MYRLFCKSEYAGREREARDSAMAVPLPEENKGFAMLQKMGYKYVGPDGLGTCCVTFANQYCACVTSDRVLGWGKMGRAGQSL